MKSLIKLSVLTQGVNVPSTRFRISQHMEFLGEPDFLTEILDAKFTAYAPSNKYKRPGWLVSTMADGFARSLRSHKSHLCLLQRNLVATLCTSEPLIKKPMVFDVDDAIFLGNRGTNADRIAKQASLIICGNSFLANHFSLFGQVEILPTAVDTEIFSVSQNAYKPTRPVIGWSGTSSGFPYLYAIESALKTILDGVPEALLKIVADRAPQFQTLPPHRVVFEQWSPAREAAVLREFSVGLMPLEDTPWARGKCSFKMLTYMACGIPVVVSPVGMNTEVLDHGACGYAASTQGEWIDTVSSLLRDEATARAMGMIGRQITQTHYARSVIGPKLAELLRTQAP
jgi:glycosyltransferase involved in cell wall biosynthesis